MSFMRKKITTLSLITVIVLSPLILLLNSYTERLEKYSGNFVRKFPYSYDKVQGFNLGLNSFYIAGISDGQIYLGNYTATPRLLKLDMDLHDTNTIMIVNSYPELKNSYYTIALDESDFNISYGLEKRLLFGSTKDWIVHNSLIPSPFFHQAIVISKKSAIFKYTSSKTHENSLRKANADKVYFDNDTVLEKQVDGKFCTAGYLQYNRQLNVLTYLFSYRNQILVLDTNLRLIKKIKTIDHIDSARFEVSKINSANSQVITKPTILVNQNCATYKNYLLVHSKIMGKGEDDTKFNRHTTIDIYDILTGQYMYSFYLPQPTKKEISQFIVINDYVYTMSDSYINRYKIKLPD